MQIKEEFPHLVYLACLVDNNHACIVHLMWRSKNRSTSAFCMESHGRDVPWFPATATFGVLGRCGLNGHDEAYHQNARQTQGGVLL